MNHETLGAALALAKKTLVSDEKIQEKVEEWLDDHPEATTTVQDGSITKAKLHSDLAEEIDGNTEDVTQLKNALQDMDGGTTGQVLRKRSNSDYAFEWADIPNAEEIANAVDDWLDDHPEATTTVQDGSLTEAKLTDATLAVLKNNYVTPQMYGAKADGTTDDTQAIQDALDSGYDVFFPEGTYLTTGVTITSEIGVHFNNSTLKAISTYQDYIISVSKKIQTHGSLHLDGDYKAYNGIVIKTAYGSDIDYIQAKKCLAWGINIDSSGISAIRHIETEYCGTIITQTLSYYSSTELTIDDAISNKNSTLLNSTYAKDMFLRDISGETSDAFPGGNTIKLITEYDSENNRLKLYNTATNAATSIFANRSCDICFGGGIYFGSKVFTQINLGNVSTKLCTVGICFGCTYGQNIQSLYSQSDYFPVAVQRYSLGNLFGSFGYEGSKSGYAMMSLFYDYSVIVVRSTAYGTNFNSNEICSIIRKSDVHSVPVHLKTASRRTIPLYYNKGETLNINEKSPDEHIVTNKAGFTISLDDKFQNNDVAYNPWGIKTVYFLPSNNPTSDINITLGSDLIEAGYSISGGTEGQLTIARPCRWFKVIVFLFGTTFYAVTEKVLDEDCSLVSIETPSGDTHSLLPYPVTYSFGEKAVLTVTVENTTQYRFMFKSPSSTATALTINGISGVVGDSITTNKTYLVDVWNGIAEIKELDITTVVNVGSDLVTLFIGRDANGKGLFTAGKIIDNNGDIVDGNRAASDVYLPINPSWRYQKTSAGRMYLLTFYDSNKEFVSQVSSDKYNNLLNTEITDIPGNAAYIRFCTNDVTSNWGIGIIRIE